MCGGYLHAYVCFELKWPKKWVLKFIFFFRLQTNCITKRVAVEEEEWGPANIYNAWHTKKTSQEQSFFCPGRTCFDDMIWYLHRKCLLYLIALDIFVLLFVCLCFFRLHAVAIDKFKDDIFSLVLFICLFATVLTYEWECTNVLCFRARFKWIVCVDQNRFSKKNEFYTVEISIYLSTYLSTVTLYYTL